MKREETFSAGLKAKWLSIAMAFALVGGSVALAQTPLSNLVFAVGTTIQASGGQNWSYLVIGSESPALLAGKQFAVYSKNGYATNAGAFSLRGKMSRQTSPAAVNTLLNQSVVLRDDLTSLSNALDVVLSNVPGATNQPLAQMLATALSLSITDPKIGSTLALLGRNHPSILLGAGQAFSESINGVTTYELREINPADGSAGDVIGRVTVIPGNPVILPAPGFPFQLPSASAAFRDGTNSTAERIKIYLRWGTPPELRRLALLNYGFNVWRMPKATAELNNFNTTPPTLSLLYANAALANDAPVMATKDFAANAPGDPTDTTTFFFVDDNGRKFGLPMFVDGAQYYYFITARDLLGRDGLVSSGTLAIACRQLPPDAPVALKVKNILQAVSVNGTPTNQSRLQLSWTQNTDTNDNVMEYWIYRWDNPSQAMTNAASALDHRIGIAPQLAGTNANSFVDNSTNLPTTPSVTNYWFTVRAVSQTACGPLLSPQSAPAWGVLREREGPPAASGEVLGSCGTPVVMFQNFNTLNQLAITNGQTLNCRLTCQRRDRGIAWVTFTFGDPSTPLGPIQFPPDGDTVSVDVSAPIDPSLPNVTNIITCTVGDYEDNAATTVTNIFITAITSGALEQEAVFKSGELLLTALSSSDPLLATLNGGLTSCSETFAVTPYPDGTVSMKFAVGGSLNIPRLVQVFSNSVWTDVGVAWPDTNHVYWVSYPACLLGPLPTFRGCGVNIPGSADCDQHITSVGGAVAPLIIRFRPTLRSREYRLYRRTDDGTPSLVAQGATTFDSANSSRSIIIPDDAMPPSAAHLCYYVQMLDEHGNGSPLALIGCKYAKPITLPRPVLAELKAVGDTNHPQVLLSWFCPVAGVHRFEIKIHRDDQNGSGQPSGLGSSRLAKRLNYNPKKTYAGLFSLRARLMLFDEVQLTPPISSDFGPGPQFSLTADVVAGGTYTISVAAVDDHDIAHDPSEPQTFTWRMPNTNVQVVPWPARPLPSVTHFDDDNGSTNFRVAAVILRYNQFNSQTYLDTRYPVGIRIGDLQPLANRFDVSYLTVGTTNFFTYRPIFFSSSFAFGLDPSQLVFRRNSSNPGRNNESLLPVVVYRLQSTNAAFPKVSGNLVQVTPLIERIPSIIVGQSDTTTVIVPDLLVGTGFESANSQLPSASNSHIYLRDLQPVLIGASYHYYVVRFNAKHEVSETIDAGAVTIPPN